MVKKRESVAAIITYGAGTASGKTSAIVDSSSRNAPSSTGETGLGSLPSTTSIRTCLSPIALRTCSTTPATVSPTMIRMLTPARAVLAMTLSAGEPDSVVTATVVRVIAADSGPAAIRARVSTGVRRAALAMSGRSASGACGAIRCISSMVGLGVLGGNGFFSSRRMARASRLVGPIFVGHRRVPAAALDGQLERGGALLGHPDHGDRRLHARERLVRDRAALVEDEPGAYAAAYQLRDRGRRGLPEDLLVAAERQPDVLRRRDVALQQPLDRLADADEAALVVEGAAAPDPAVDDVGAERGVLPGCLLVDGDHVEVRHQHDRPVGGAAAPVEEQAVGVDAGEVETLVQQRELALELGEERVEGIGVDQRRVAVRDGGDADECLQLRHHPVSHGRTLACLGSEIAGGAWPLTRSRAPDGLRGCQPRSPHLPWWTTSSRSRRGRRAGDPLAPGR